MSLGWEALMLCRAFSSRPGMLLACGSTMMRSTSRKGDDEMREGEGDQLQAWESRAGEDVELTKGE